MVQSYYTLQQAAEVLGKTTDELNQMVRRNEIRAFADGGSWKFRTQDIDELKRTQELLSEVDILTGSDDDLDLLFEDSTPSVEMKSPSDSTIGRELQADPGLKGSGESDVRLIFSGEDSGSDSDIKLVPDFTDEPKFAADDSSKSPGDSDIHLLLEDEDSGETLSLERSASATPAPSDSDIRLFIEDLEPAPAETSAGSIPPEAVSASPEEEPDFLFDDSIDEPQVVSEATEEAPAQDNPAAASEMTEVFSLASQPTEELTFEPETEPAPVAPASDSGLIPLASDDDEIDLFDDSDDDLLLEEAKSEPPVKPEGTPSVAAAAKKDDEFSFDDDDLGIDFKLDGAEDIDLADLDLADKTPTIKQEAGDDSDSDFDLNLDDDIGLAQDVTPGAGDSGINLARPDDSGILLKKAADSGIKLRQDDTDSSDSEFDVSLESDDDIFGSDETPGFKASDTAPRMSAVEEDSSDEISDSDFELAIDDVELDDDEESGSEVVAVSEDDEEDSSDDFDEEDEDEAYGSEDVEHLVVNAEPAPWGGVWVGFLTATTLVFAVVMMVMYEITRNAWSYNEPYSLSATIIETIYGFGKGILY
jgi:excisionase family DNA binding protein